MSKLNEDILFLLFKKLQDDSKSLFSCLMINKVWCETIIPILWNNPWHYNINYYEKSSLYYIINFYLVNDIKVKEFLTSQEIQLPQILHKSLLFDYLSFCKSIDVKVIDKIIHFESSFSRSLLRQEFCNILMRKCSELKYLDMRSMRSIKYQMFYSPEAKVRLNSLCEFKCDTSIDPSFFYEFACICQNIQRLTIDKTTARGVNYGVIKLIEVQNSLKYFEWSDDFGEIIIDYDDGYNHKEYFYALITKADTLNHLIISFQYIKNCDHNVFLEEVLPELHKLKTLKIDFPDLSYKEIQKTLVCHDLEVFNIDYFTMKASACIIENSRGCLREILFLQEPYCYDYNNCRDDIENNSLILIRKIYENCPLVEYLSLVFPPLKEYFTEFKKLLRVCQNLKSLLLLAVNELYGNGENLLEILVEFAPTSLIELRFDFIVSPEALETFLEKWKGRPALSMLTDNPVYIKEDYKNLINKYKHVGVIKDFRHCLDMYYPLNGLLDGKGRARNDIISWGEGQV